MWAPEHIEKVTKDIGEMVEVDEYVEDRKRMDVARILIRTSRRPRLQEVVLATIDGVDYHLDVIEELPEKYAQRNNFRGEAGFPPSPFSTQANTPFSAGDSPPVNHFDNVTPAGGSPFSATAPLSRLLS